MRFSTKGRYAVTAMIDIALREQFGPVPLNEIATRQHISLSYLEQLFSKLRLQGLVTSNRGPGGGYSLGVWIGSITVADILCAVDDGPSKPKQQSCTEVQDLTQDLWDTLNAQLLHFTQSVTLKSLVRDQLALSVKTEKKPPPRRGVFTRPVQQSVRPNVPNSVFALGRMPRTQG